MTFRTSVTSGELLVRNLRIRYPDATHWAVNGLSLHIGHGETVAVVGETGSGKSTAALGVTRLLAPAVEITADALQFDGEDVLTLGRNALRRLRGRRIGMVFQSPRASWNPTRTIGAQLADGLKASGRWPFGMQRLLQLLQRVGIDRAAATLDDYPHHLSGGMLQRAMIAGVLANEPSLLIADEPTSALDSTVQAELLDLLEELQSETNLSLMLISHDFGVVARVADYTVVLYGGNMVETGKTLALYEAASHPYTLGLLAAIPRLDSQRKVMLNTMGQGELATSGCIFAPRCPLMIERCRTETPVLRQVNETLVACHRAEESRRMLRWSV